MMFLIHALTFNTLSISVGWAWSSVHSEAAAELQTFSDQMYILKPICGAHLKNL